MFRGSPSIPRQVRLTPKSKSRDSVICCKMFPAKHKLSDDGIARALGILHQECANMTGQDVVELYSFLQTYPDLHTNGIRLWQQIDATVERSKEDNKKITKAISRFTNCGTDARHST